MLASRTAGLFLLVSRGFQFLLLLVPIDRKFDQFINEFGIRKSACLPHFRIHADRGESGDGVV